MKETNCRAHWRILFALLLLLLQCYQQAQAIGSIGVGIGVGSSSGVAAYGLQCQRIAVSACQGLGYNMTALPNLAGHTNQLEAELQIAKLLPLIESGCSKRARFLLCSALFPLCSPDVPRPVTACKSLCETVKEECAVNAKPELMQLWPQFLSCESLPQPENHELCMQIPQETAGAGAGAGAATAAEATAADGGGAQHTATATAAATAAAAAAAMGGGGGTEAASEPPQQQQMYWSWMAWKMSSQLGKPQQAMTNGAGRYDGIAGLGGSIICPLNFSGNPLNAAECLPQCQRDAFHSTQQKKLTESLILGLSAVCFVLTLFALVTFWAEPTRFGYPERPVLFLCLCYNLFSVCYLERIVFHQARSLALLQQEPGRAGGAAGTAAGGAGAGAACTLTPPCLASYISTSYLSLCAASWWLIFALCFYLSSHKKWSSEALEKRSGLFHVLAWVPPLAPPIAALLLERVRPSELTGMCTAPGFVELPALVLLLLGLYFTLRASRSLHSLQQQLQPTLAHQRFAQIRKRFVIFSLLFFVPTAAGVVAAFCERYVDAVPSCSALDALECPQPAQLSAWPALVRIFFQLVGGTLTGMWVWSRKTCESYRSRLVAAAGSPTSSLMTSHHHKAGYVGHAGHAGHVYGHAATLPKKHFYASGKSMLSAATPPPPSHTTSHASSTAPLYAGISFHNVPVYNPNQSRV